jgi:toxin ParE1/3/4
LRFIISVENAIDRILEDPFRYRTFEEDVRRCLTRTFPYAGLYSIEDGLILIVAVAHLSREPGYYWKQRVS